MQIPLSELEIIARNRLRVLKRNFAPIEVRYVAFKLAKEIFYSQVKGEKIIGCIYTVQALFIAVEPERYSQVTKEISKKYGSLNNIPQGDRDKYGVKEAVAIISIFPLQDVRREKIYEVCEGKLYSNIKDIKFIFSNEIYEEPLKELFN